MKTSLVSLLASITLAGEIQNYNVQQYFNDIRSEATVTLDDDNLDLSFTDINSISETYQQTINLNNLLNNGRYTAVNFWEPWCGPCIEELPELERLHKNGFDVVGLSTMYSREQGAQQYPNVAEKLSRVTFPYTGLEDEAEQINALRNDICDIDFYPLTLVFDDSGSWIRAYIGTISKEKTDDLITLIKKK